MRALKEAWRAFFRRGDPVVATGVQWRAGPLARLRACGLRVYRFSMRVNDWMQEADRNNERLGREAARRERRASRRALSLMLRMLTAEQRQEFKTHRYFHVTGGSTGDRYRIRMDMIANIDVLREDGMVKHRLCVRPAGDIPVCDVMAAQLLHLQDSSAERRFLQEANIHSTLPESHLCFRGAWIT